MKSVNYYVSAHSLRSLPAKILTELLGPPDLLLSLNRCENQAGCCTWRNGTQVSAVMGDCFYSTSTCCPVLCSQSPSFSQRCCRGTVMLPFFWVEALRWVWQSGSSRPVGDRTTPPHSGRRGRSSRSRPHRKRRSKGLRSNERASTGR